MTNLYTALKVLQRSILWFIFVIFTPRALRHSLS